MAQALIKGAVLDLRGRADSARRVNADVIRDLLLGRWPDNIDQGSAADLRGLRLQGATVTGQLDLDYLRTDIGLELLDCAIAYGITAYDARLTRLVLTGSTVGNREAKESALRGAGLTVPAASSSSSCAPTASAEMAPSPCAVVTSAANSYLAAPL
jgi:hypothetical protein